MLILYIISLFLLLLLLAETLRRLPLKTGILFWAAAPIILLPLWLHNSTNWDWFLWVKTYSVLIPCLLLFILRHKQRLSDRVIGWGWYILYTLNILEAVVFDMSSGNHLNALLGVALILLMPSPRTIQIEYGLKESNLSFDLPLSWIMAYTIWNFGFIYGNWAGFAAAQHIAVLAVPFFIAWRLGWRYWSQARAITLGLFLVVYNSFYPWFVNEFESSAWQNPTIAIFIAVVGILILMVPWLQKRFVTYFPQHAAR